MVLMLNSLHHWRRARLEDTRLDDSVPRHVYNSRKPIQTAADFKGMKIRVMESPVMVRTFQLLGAIPVPISAAERYMALQTGVVDGAENSVGIILSEKEYEVTKYVSLTAHNITPKS
jgi:TRAP-type C4-dicarboxylate transport system substrate-binding protein